MQNHPVPPALGAKHYPGWLFLLAIISTIGPLSIDMYLPAFSAMSRGLGTDSGRIQLTLGTFMIGMVLGQAVYGPLSDRYGRKPPLYAGMLLFVLASAGCMLATEITTLVVMRFIQGLGACAGVVIPRAVVRDKLGPRDTAKAFSMLMLVFGLAPILAPTMGGLLLTAWGWESIFAVLMVFGLICIAGLYKGLNETLPPENITPLHPKRVLKQYGALLKNRSFVSYAVCGGLLQAGLFAYITGSPFVLVELYGVAPEHFGLVFGLNAIGLIGGSQVNARLLRRYTSEQILGKVLLIPPLVTLALVALVVTDLANVWLLGTGLFIYMSCYGLVSPNTAAIALSAHGKQAGTASSMMGLLHFSFGMTSGLVMSQWHDGTAMPLVSIMGAGAVMALMLFRNVRGTSLPGTWADKS